MMPVMKQRVYERLGLVLSLRKPDAEFDVARAVAAVPVQRDYTSLLKPLRADMRK